MRAPSHLASLFAGTFLLVSVSSSFSALLLSDDFQGYVSDPTGSSGGSGDWNSAWTQGSQNTGGSYLNGSSKIDGTRSYGLYGNSGAAGTSRNRGFTATTTPFTIAFSFRADYNVSSDDGDGNYSRRIAFTVRDGNSTDHFSGQRLSFFFAEGSGNLQWFDGSGRSSSAVTFTTGAIYDFSVAVDPSSRSYSFTGAQRGGNSMSYSGNWSLGSDGESLDSLAIFMRGPAGEGNDAFFDSITAVPEPTNVALAAFGILSACTLILRRLRASRAINLR